MMLLLSWMSASVFFSTSFLGLSFLSSNPMPLEFMMFYRLLIASLIIAFITIITKKRFLIKKNEFFVLLIVSVSQLNSWLQAYGTKYIISGLVSCVCLSQIFVAEFVGSIVDKRKMRRKIIVSGLIGVAGLAMLLNKEIFASNNADFSIKNTIIGVSFAFISTFAAVIGNIVYEKNSKIFVEQMPRTTFMMYNCLFGGLLLLVLGLVFQPASNLFNPALKDIKYIAVLSYLSITSSVISLFAMYYIIEKQGAVKVAYLNLIIPVLSMLISTFAEGYKWNVISVIGMISMLVSVWIGIKPDKKASQ